MRMCNFCSTFAVGIKITTMINNFFAKFCAVLMAVMVLVSCERNDGKDPRDAFVGDYTFVSTGSIEFEIGVPPLNTMPINETGEMSIVKADKENAVWVIADNDTSVAYVSGNQFFMEPSIQKEKFGPVEMVLEYTYSPALLKDNVLTLESYVDVTAIYDEKTVAGHGEVEVVATKK